MMSRHLPHTNKSWLSPRLVNLLSVFSLIGLMLISVSVGVSDFSWANAMSADMWQLLITSRLPRTLAIVLTGVAMAMCGMIMQVALKNRFVEPSMVGATQSAVLGLLAMTLVFPAASLIVKMTVASLSAFVGMLIFLQLIRRLPTSDVLIVPLVGIVFGGIIEAVTTFFAYETETLQLLSVWQFGDFSHILAGRYELLWGVGFLCVVAYVLADKLTIIGLGDNIATNLGVDKTKVMLISIAIVAMMSAVVVVTVGAIPFVGLVVPNIVSRLVGDRLRKSLPAVAIFGASAVLLCDIIGRVIRYPFEVPVATVFGVAGAFVFLLLLLKKS